MSRVAAGPTRRVVLGVPAMAAPVLLIEGCGGGSKPGAITPQQAAARDEARDRALAAEHTLVTRYDAVLAAPGVKADAVLSARLTAVRAEHVAHAAALMEGTVPATTPPSTTPPAAASSASAPGGTAADPKTLVAGLAQAERDAADRLTADVLATDGHTAQLLASIAASESGHAALLGGAA